MQRPSTRTREKPAFVRSFWPTGWTTAAACSVVKCEVRGGNELPGGHGEKGNKCACQKEVSHAGPFFWGLLSRLTCHHCHYTHSLTEGQATWLFGVCVPSSGVPCLCHLGEGHQPCSMTRCRHYLHSAPWSQGHKPPCVHAPPSPLSPPSQGIVLGPRVPPPNPVTLEQRPSLSLCPQGAAAYLVQTSQ